MPREDIEYIYIVTQDFGFIKPLGIPGPILNPLKVEKRAACQMVMNGNKVYECDTATGQRTLLTLEGLAGKGKVADGETGEESGEGEIPPPPPVDPIGEPAIPVQVPGAIDGTPEETKEDDSDEATNEEAPLITFEFTQKGKVDESKIDWTQYSNEQRKVIRDMIVEHNKSV